MNKFKDFKIVKNFKIFGPVSLAMILIGVILFVTIGLNVGLDFAGGAKLEVNLGNTALTEEMRDKTESEIKKIINNEKFDISSIRFGGDDKNIIEIGLNYKYDGKKIDSSNIQSQQDFLNKINGTKEGEFKDGLCSTIEEALINLNPDFEDEVEATARIVGGSTALKLLKNAIWAVLAAILVMLIYIMIRFTLSFGLASILALIHDVLIMFTLMAIFRIPVNTTIIAAAITIIGYSINATIVIFDKIRELKKLESMKGVSDEEIADLAIKATLGRTILTTLTTFATILVLTIVCWVMGISAMNEFALPIIFGLIAGTYSSIFLASSFWVYISKLGKRIKARARSKKAKKV